MNTIPEWINPFYVNAFLCAASYFYHMLEKWTEYRQEHPVTLSQWWATYPAKNTTSLFGSVLAFVGCYAVGWMNPGMAMACGYMGDSITRRVVDRFGQGQ